jgi:two-component system sensor kinase FixL
LAQIADQANHAGNVIRQLRAFVSRTHPHHSVVNLNALIQTALRLAEAELRPALVKVTLEFADEVTIVSVDRTQIAQVLLNLVRNAVEAMNGCPPEQRVLTIRVRHSSPSVVEVTVEDTGLGVSAEIVDGLFEPFRTTKPRGMGMGLAISRRIVEAHGGRLWAERNPAAGATFRFTLPSL